MEPEFAAARMADYDRMAREWERIGDALEADPTLVTRLGFTQRLSLGWFAQWLVRPQAGLEAASQ